MKLLTYETTSLQKIVRTSQVVPEEWSGLILSAFFPGVGRQHSIGNTAKNCVGGEHMRK